MFFHSAAVLRESFGCKIASKAQDLSFVEQISGTLAPKLPYLLTGGYILKW